MTNLSDNSIKISLNIEIPLNGEPPCVNVTTSHKPREIAAGANVILITAFPPAFGSGLAHINSANTICVNGTAQDQNGNRADTIFAKIYPNIYTTIPLDPTSEAPISFAPTGVAWLIDNLSGATPSGTFTVVAWAKWFGGAFSFNSRVFQTDAGGPYTDCTYPSLIGQQQLLAAPCTFELIPVAWRLKTQGFSGSSATRLNGEWKLHLTKASGQKVLYCNGGDGVTTPRIQLCCEHPLAPAWELSFAYDGSRVVYTRPANQFDGQCRNVFQNAMTLGLGEDAGIPAIISILPV